MPHILSFLFPMNYNLHNRFNTFGEDPVNPHELFLTSVKSPLFAKSYNRGQSVSNLHGMSSAHPIAKRIKIEHYE